MEEVNDIDGVVDSHNLHVWTLSVGKTVCTVHLQVREGAAELVLREAKKRIAKLGFEQSTVELKVGECDDEYCRGARKVGGEVEVEMADFA